MLLPSRKPLFENVSSRDYYAMASELRGKALNGCIHIAYPDFEEAILFSAGQPASAFHQSKRWLTVGDDLVEPAENKALTADGKMTVYELPKGLLNIFIHTQVTSMVETELGPYMTAGLLIEYLEIDKSTCILKLEDDHSAEYVFINFGKLIGAVYKSPEGRRYDDDAIKAAGRFKEHTYMAIYFIEVSQKYLKSRADVIAEPGTQKPVMPLAPPEPSSPFPMEASRPRAQTAQALGQAPAKPARAPPVVKLVVAMSEDRHIGLRHRSRLQTLEAFEEGNVAWVDSKTIKLLNHLGPNARIILPNGREYPVMLKEAPIQPEESRYIILPRKLRRRLSIGKGETLEVKASV